MSHTKQTPILNYTTANLPVGVASGTVVFNTDENCLNYYNGEEWISSSDWNSTYTTVSSNSAIWNQAGNYDHTLIETTSANWDSTYTTVSSNSADWSNHFDSSLIEATSANWDSTYTTVSSNSADWSNHFDSSLIENTSANWDSTYTTVSSNSAIWSDHFDSSLIETTSATWDSTYTTVSSNSADWVKYNDTFILNDPTSYPGWVVDEDNFISNSNIRVPTQQSVKFYVDNIVTGVNSLKGGYDASTDTPELTAGVGVLQGDTYYVTVSGNFYDTQIVDPGDLIIATTNSANLSSEWIVVNRNIEDELIDRWNSTYTTVSSNSAIWADHFDSTLIESASANWDSTYTTVSSNSANWGPAGLPEATSTVYVTKDGDDTYDGFSITQAKDTISAAITVASNLITGGATAVNIEILDSSDYSENINLGDGMILNGPTATLKGTITTDASSTTHVILKEQQSVTTLTDLVNPGSGGTMFYKANRVTVSSSCRAIHAEISGTYIYADIDTIEVGGGSFGLVAGGGLLFAQVKYIELVGPAATGIASIGSGAVSATVEWISEFGPQNAIGIDCQAGSVDVDTKNLGVGSTSGRAYKVTSGTLKLTAIRLVGNTQGTPAFLFTENNYNNDNWDSTYTTVGDLSAIWGEAAGTEFNPDNNGNTTQLALNIKERGTSYPQHENIVQGNLRGASAVDLQIYRNAADQVAAGPRSVLIGGDRNKVSTLSNASTITGGYQNVINLSNYSTIVGGINNIINKSQSVACGQHCEINHEDSFMFNDNGTAWPTVSANTFNVKALNGMRLEFDTTPIPGQVLTCLESNGISKWASLSADEWNSTYTTVSANSATWDITYTTVGSNSATWDTTTVYTVSTLPSAIGAAGSRAFVSDSDVTHAAGVGTQVVNNGSGAEFVPVYSNGSIWLIG